MDLTYNDNDYRFAYLQRFDKDKFEYWKVRIESFILGQDVDLWDMVSNGYTHPLDDICVWLEISHMNEQQRKNHKNHHESEVVYFIPFPILSIRRLQIKTQLCLYLIL